MKRKYNKLVRDKIVDKLKSQDIQCKYHVASSPEEYSKKLGEKLVEEAEEFLLALTKNNSAKIEELADVAEVVLAACEFLGITPEDLNRHRKYKKGEKGGFTLRIILETTSE